MTRHCRTADLVAMASHGFTWLHIGFDCLSAFGSSAGMEVRFSNQDTRYHPIVYSQQEQKEAASL